MYHVPGFKGEEHDVKGLVGEVKNVIHTVNGHVITATKPVLVVFKDPKFRAHFDDDELEEA